MARGDLDRAGRLATQLRRTEASSTSSYLMGRAELLLERPESAVEALRAAAAQDPENPLVLHALGLAEAATHHEARALIAFQQALDSNPRHVATLIDRALLQVHRTQGGRGVAQQEAARRALEEVATKLTDEASPEQLART